MKNLFTYIFLLFIFGCTNNEDIIKREIKLKEARKGYELVKFSINRQENIKDTSAVYFQASIKINSKDSAISDSIFFIKDKDGVLLPFSTNPQTGN